MEHGAPIPLPGVALQPIATSSAAGWPSARLRRLLPDLLLVLLAISFVMAERRLAWRDFALLWGGGLALVCLATHRWPDGRGGRAEIVTVLGLSFGVGIVTSTLLAFNLLPSLLAYALIGAQALALGGARLLGVASALHLLGLALGLALGDRTWAPQTSEFVMLGCLPLLVLQPLVNARRSARQLHAALRDHDALERRSRLDGLTGLYRRDYWESQVRAAFVACQRDRRPATLVMADLDHFKRINDRYGHDGGDRVLRAFAALLRRQLRDADVCGRYGGEEFGILMPDTTAAQARHVIERLRAEVRGQRCLPDLVVTASFGLAQWSPVMADHADWMRQADRMLYRAKHEGRDRLVLEAGQAPAHG